MGGERTWAGKLVYLYIACLIFYLAACATPTAHKTEEAPQAPKPVEKPDEESRQEKIFKLSSAHLLQAKKLLAQGDFEGALKESRSVLVLSGRNSPGDEALFTMGLVYAHYKNPKKDFNKASAFFERLSREYPQSALYEQSRIWIGVLQVIEKSKQVDIEIEEMKEGLSR